ncbi:MAG: hypothetical protein FWF06_08235 [Symbiobacteriaceae bacterium]|nr:hypothetical protein [Symbiobacteriaceae bacterium]
MNNTHSRGAVLALAWQNATRWRWRLVTMAVLIALSFALHTLYGAYMGNIASSGIASTLPLQISNFDVMVLLKEGVQVKSREELPIARYRRQLYGHGEGALGGRVEAAYGTLDALGLEQGSLFYRFPASEALVGSPLMQRGEILLPLSYVTQGGLALGDTLVLSVNLNLERRYLELTLVGIYREEGDYAPAVLHLEDLQLLYPHTPLNRYLINYDRLQGEATLLFLVEWMSSAYPGALLLCDHLPRMVSQTLLSRIMQPGAGLLVLIFTFMGIGVWTVALMTFLERRKEIASLKSIGISNSQMVTLNCLEYGISTVAGWTLGVTLVLVMGQQFSWLQETEGAALRRFLFQGGTSSFVVMAVAVLFPTLTARVATVNQLLYARVIPLRIIKTRSLPRAQGWLVLRERRENVRILQMPTPQSEPSFICFKNVGDFVKEGEVVGAIELYGGLVLQEWAAWVDGEVVEYHVGGIFAIRPLHPDASFYPYPESIIRDELNRAASFERGRASVHQDIISKP